MAKDEIEAVSSMTAFKGETLLLRTIGALTEHREIWL